MIQGCKRLSSPTAFFYLSEHVLTTDKKYILNEDMYRSMGQEDAEKKIGFECLKTIVDDAINTKNICIIEKIENEKKLRYMQKYAERLVSKDENLVGMGGYVLAILAIGASYLLVNVSEPQKSVYPTIGLIILILGAFVLLIWIFIHKPRTEFINEIILKIEEKLLVGK